MRDRVAVIIQKLIAFFTNEEGVKKELNPTLGGYVNKVMSFWLLKAPEETLSMIISNKSKVLSSLFRHLYMG
jgi:hypothetical protein